MTSEVCGDVSSVGTPVAASAGTPVASLVAEGAEFMRPGQMHRQSPLPEAWLEKLLARQTAWDEREPTETSTTLWQTLKRRAAALLAWQAEDEQKNQETLLEQVSISGDVSTPEKAKNRPLLEQVSISGDVSTPEKDVTVQATAGGVGEAPAETAMHFAVGEALGCRSQDPAVSSEDDGTGCTDLLYSYLLQGPPDSADCRIQCAAALRARREPDPSWSLVEMLEEATKNCAQCRKPLRSHRVSYLYGGRRVVLSFKKEGGHVELVCRCCSHHWLLPDERSERLMTIPALDFVTMLWSGEVLPCGHDFVEGSWHVGNQVFEVREAKLVALDWMRGPALRLPLRDEDDFRRKAKLLEDGCLKAIDMVEQILEEKLKPILLQFKFCRHRQFQKQRSLSARFGRRFCEVLDMLRHRRRTLRRELREARHELVCVGAVCRMSELFEDCFALALEADFHVGSKSSSLSSISEDYNKDDINKGRSSSVPPDCRYEWQTSAKPEELADVATKDSYLVDDILAWMPWRKGAERTKTDPGSFAEHSLDCDDPVKFRRAQSHVIDTNILDGESTLPNTNVNEARAQVRDQLQMALAAADICPGSENFQLNSSSGVLGAEIPLEETGTNMSTAIARALLSSTCWEKLQQRANHYCCREARWLRCPDCDPLQRRWKNPGPESGVCSHCHVPVVPLELQGACLHSILGDEPEESRAGSKAFPLPAQSEEDPPIGVDFTGPGGVQWSVTILQPLRFHLIRHLAFGDDAEFCRALQHSDQMVLKGGKSKANFWISRCGKFVLKEVKAGEAKKLEKMVAGPLGDLLSAAAGVSRYNLEQDDSGALLLADLYGLFQVHIRRRVSTTHHLIVMRNLRCGIEDDAEWQLFDLKGVGSKRAQKADTLASAVTQGVDAGSPSGVSDSESSRSELASLERPLSPKLPPHSQHVAWDAGWMRAFDGFPLTLRRQDYASLQEVLSRDTHILEVEEVVDYSMFVAVRQGELTVQARDAGAAGGNSNLAQSMHGLVRLGLIDYLQPYTLGKKIESTVKVTVYGTATIVNPAQYRQRFCHFMLQAFESDPS